MCRAALQVKNEQQARLEEAVVLRIQRGVLNKQAKSTTSPCVCTDMNTAVPEPMMTVHRAEQHAYKIAGSCDCTRA